MRVVRPYVPPGFDHFGASKDLDLEGVPRSACPQQRIHKLFHRMGAVFDLLPSAGVMTRQQKVVHTSNPCDRVEKAGRNA